MGPPAAAGQIWALGDGFCPLEDRRRWNGPFSTPGHLIGKNVERVPIGTARATLFPRHGKQVERAGGAAARSTKFPGSRRPPPMTFRAATGLSQRTAVYGQTTTTFGIRGP